MTGTTRILISCGEPSGDLYGAELVKALRPTVPGLEVFGLGGDRLAARVAAALKLPGHPPAAAAAAANKRTTRDCLLAAGLPTPPYIEVPVSHVPDAVVRSVTEPVVVKPLGLSGSRGVMRADTPGELAEALERLGALLASKDVRSDREIHDRVLIERFIHGREFAVEGLMTKGTFSVLAIFDKPDPLDGPFFEETIYVTPSRATSAVQSAIADTVARGARALGLSHGPVHAECRVNEHGVWVLEIAARPIGGLCARALRFVRRGSSRKSDQSISLEEMLLRHAVGERMEGWIREPQASGVMMIPIPARGVLRAVAGEGAARAVPGVLKAVKWNSPMYGVEEHVYFVSFHCFTKYVKAAFFRGASLRPVPPGASKQKHVRYLDIHEDDRLDEAQFIAWVQQASQLPGERM